MKKIIPSYRELEKNLMNHVIFYCVVEGEGEGEGEGGWLFAG